MVKALVWGSRQHDGWVDAIFLIPAPPSKARCSLGGCFVCGGRGRVRRYVPLRVDLIRQRERRRGKRAKREFSIVLLLPYMSVVVVVLA